METKSKMLFKRCMNFVKAQSGVKLLTTRRTHLKCANHLYIKVILLFHILEAIYPY